MPPPPTRRTFVIVKRTITLAAIVAASFVSIRAEAQTLPPTNPLQPAIATPLPTPSATPTPDATEPSPAGSAAPSVSALPSTSPTPPTGRRLRTFAVSAKQIAFYSNRFIIGADGHVDVTLGDGTHVTGNTFAMDLRLNRFVIAGDVTITAGATTQHGAAFAEFFDFDRAYFIPITSEPDRWTFTNGDYAHPLLGREMPGDTFALPDLSGDRVFLRAENARIDPHESVRFTPASVNFGLGAYVEFPSYFLNFSPNPNFAQNSLPGAFVDGPLDFAGGDHSLLTAHIRYDAQNKIFPAIEGHLVSDNSYIVGSVSPLTRPFKQYNLLAFDRVSPGLQVQAAFQESAFQHAFTQPLSATAYVALQITGSLRQSYVQLSTMNYYDSLLGMPQVLVDAAGTPLYFYGDPTHNFVPDHPVNVQLSWIGYRQKFLKVFGTQVRSGLTFSHNEETPLSTLGGVNYDSVYGKSFGFSLTTDSFTLLKDDAHRPRLYVTGTFDKQRSFYSIPHFVDAQSENVSLTDVIIPRKLTALLSYQNSNQGDFYGAQQAAVYPPGETAPYINPYTGQLIPELAAFRGFATTRQYNEEFVYTPSAAATFNLTLRQDVDYPIATAGPPTVTGPETSFQNYGNPPFQATLDARFRLPSSLVLEVSRAYYFGFGGYERFSPQFYVQILR
jgi:hypothetical protein